MESNIYSFWYFLDNKENDESLKPLWRKVPWSLKWASLGKWPDKDECGKKYYPRSLEGRRANTELAGGMFLVLYTLKQDLDHLVSEYGLADYRSNQPCELCPANKISGDWPSNFPQF